MVPERQTNTTPSITNLYWQVSMFEKPNLFLYFTNRFPQNANTNKISKAEKMNDLIDVCISTDGKPDHFSMFP